MDIRAVSYVAAGNFAGADVRAPPVLVEQIEAQYSLYEHCCSQSKCVEEGSRILVVPTPSSTPMMRDQPQ